MLDLEYICQNLKEVKKRLQTRNADFSYLDELVTLNKQRKNLIIKGDQLKQEKNEFSSKIGKFKREKKDVTKLLKEIDGFKDEISKIDLELNAVNQTIKDILLKTPNLPSADIPVGKDETSNKEIKKVRKPKKFKFQVKDHADLGLELDLFDFQRAAKIAATRFVYEIGLGARLERALINFMFDCHIKRNYKEVIPPYIVNEDSMYGTGQFPKFKEDAFKLENHNLYLNPTAEVPLINMYRNEILKGEDLPIKYVAYSTAFRQEAGSAGRDTKGIIRQHQFNKVELIKFCRPENSDKELEEMLASSEQVLKELKLPYRVVMLSTGDLGFSMTKTYDIEVWLPSQNTYREIASISNACDYQARRSQIRYKENKNDKTKYVHTLNGSGLAVGRTVVAILENYQQEDGSVLIPEKLVPYMNGIKSIKK